VRDRALSAEAVLLTQYDAALALPSVASDSGLTAKLKAIREEHASHAVAIQAGYTPPSAPPSTTTPSGSAPTDAPTDAKTAVATLAKAEQDAASARTSDILAADGDTAMLLASIAAAESGHAALLLGGAA